MEQRNRKKKTFFTKCFSSFDKKNNKNYKFAKKKIYQSLMTKEVRIKRKQKS